MTQHKPEDKVTAAQVLKLVNQLPKEEQDELLQQMKLEDLRRELQLGIDQLDRGEGIPGEQVFAELRKQLQQKGRIE